MANIFDDFTEYYTKINQQFSQVMQENAKLKEENTRLHAELQSIRFPDEMKLSKLDIPQVPKKVG